MDIQKVITVLFTSSLRGNTYRMECLLILVVSDDFLNRLGKISDESIDIKKTKYLVDYVTGSQIVDTPENRVRLKVEHFLVDDLGYSKNEIKVKPRTVVTLGRKKQEVEADLIVYMGNKPMQVIETKAIGEDLRIWREQALSYAKINTPPIPRAVITTFEETEVWDVFENKKIAEGKQAILARNADKDIALKGYRHFTEHELDAARRKLITFENPKQFARVFETCHNIIRSQKGLDPKQRLYEMCKIILVKMYEERLEEHRKEKDSLNRFTIDAIEKDERLGGNAYDFINRLFKEVREKQLKTLFQGHKTIDLKPHTIKAIVSNLEPYSLTDTREDVLGVAFEIFLKGTMTGKDLGEFFTPREIVDFMVEIVDPQLYERILDPACGSGGFIIKSFFHLLDKTHSENEKENMVNNCLWGIDVYEDLRELASVNLKIHGDGYKHIYRANSLDLVDVVKQNEELDGIEEDNKVAARAVRDILLTEGGFDIILTNPPFGSGKGKDIDERTILDKYDNGKNKQNQIPQILFIELCIKLLKNGGRMAIVLPDSILNNLGENYYNIRNYIMKKTAIKAIISLPSGAFSPYNSGVKASILYVQKIVQNPEDEVFASTPKYVGYETNKKIYRQISQNDLVMVKHEFKKWYKKDEEK